MMEPELYSQIPKEVHIRFSDDFSALLLLMLDLDFFSFNLQQWSLLIQC